MPMCFYLVVTTTNLCNMIRRKGAQERKAAREDTLLHACSLGTVKAKSSMLYSVFRNSLMTFKCGLVRWNGDGAHFAACVAREHK